MNCLHLASTRPSCQKPNYQFLSVALDELNNLKTRISKLNISSILLFFTLQIVGHISI